MKKRLVVSVSTLLAVLMLATSAFARWEVDAAANWKVNLPDNWTVQARGQVMVTHPVLPGLSMEFVGIAEGGGESFLAERNMMAAVGRSLRGAHITVPAHRITQNGMAGMIFEGTGTSATGTPVTFVSYALSTGPTTGVLGIAFAAPGQFQVHRRAIVEIFGSLTRIH